MNARQRWLGMLAVVVSAGSLGCGTSAMSTGTFDHMRVGERLTAPAPASVQSPSSPRSERHRSSGEHLGSTPHRRARSN
jgi:hypothetical protein